MRWLNGHTVPKAVFLGVLLTCVMLPVAGYGYLRYGPVPVATSDTPFPDEEQIVHIALDARISRQLTSAPFSPTPEVLTAGAHIFVEHCAVCHGTPNRTSAFGKWMYPTAPQLWTENGKGVVGVSDDPAGVSFWKVQNGIRLTGMPSFNHSLSETEMWQVSLLLLQAGQTLPSTVTDVLTRVAPAATRANAANSSAGKPAR